jgi:hypothetical protein
VTAAICEVNNKILVRTKCFLHNTQSDRYGKHADEMDRFVTHTDRFMAGEAT